jgi:hypothetical protein
MTVAKCTYFGGSDLALSTLVNSLYLSDLFKSADRSVECNEGARWQEVWKSSSVRQSTILRTYPRDSATLYRLHTDILFSSCVEPGFSTLCRPAACQRSRRCREDWHPEQRMVCLAPPILLAHAVRLQPGHCSTSELEVMLKTLRKIDKLRELELNPDSWALTEDNKDGSSNTTPHLDLNHKTKCFESMTSLDTFLE